MVLYSNTLVEQLLISLNSQQLFLTLLLQLALTGNNLNDGVILWGTPTVNIT